MKRALLYLFISSLLTLLCNAQAPTAAIKVDQVGYLSSSPKIALVSAPGKNFAVKRVSDEATAFEAKLSAPTTDQDTGDTVQAADFSSLKTAGNYYVDPMFTTALSTSRCAASTGSVAG
jgi:endoglucanase